MKNVELPKLHEQATIPFMLCGIQIYHLIDWIIEQVGAVEVKATTFSVAEEFLRAMFRQKKDGKVKGLTIICDLKSAEKTAKINTLLRNIADKVYLAENHSKIVLLKSENKYVTIVTSQNQTRGNRTEGGIITSDPNVYNYFDNAITTMINDKSILWGAGDPLPKSL